MPVDYFVLLCFGTSFKRIADTVSSPPALGPYTPELFAVKMGSRRSDNRCDPPPAVSAGQQCKAGLDGDSCTQDTGGSCYFFGCAVRKPSTLLRGKPSDILRMMCVLCALVAATRTKSHFVEWNQRHNLS